MLRTSKEGPESSSRMAKSERNAKTIVSSFLFHGIVPAYPPLRCKPAMLWPRSRSSRKPPTEAGQTAAIQHKTGEHLSAEMPTPVVVAKLKHGHLFYSTLLSAEFVLPEELPASSIWYGCPQEKKWSKWRNLESFQYFNYFFKMIPIFKKI